MPHSTIPPRPFYQGSLDAFCAIYAVLNAWRRLFGLRHKEAGVLFRETLLSMDRQALRDVLEQKADYGELVDTMLARNEKRFPLAIERILPASLDAFQQSAKNWLAVPGSAILLRHDRHLTPSLPAFIRHWTVADGLDGDALTLYDATPKTTAISRLPLDEIALSAGELTPARLIQVQPQSLRYLRRKN